MDHLDPFPRLGKHISMRINCELNIVYFVLFSSDKPLTIFLIFLLKKMSAEYSNSSHKTLLQL